MREARWLSGKAVISEKTQVRNQVDALAPFGKALILISKSPGKDLKQSAPWLLTDKNTHAFIKVRSNKQTNTESAYLFSAGKVSPQRTPSPSFSSHHLEFCL